MKRNSVKFSFRGMNQDVSEGKHPLEFYYEGKNIRLLTTSERITGGLSFEKGNELKLSLPDITINTSANVIELSNGDKIKYKNNNEIDKQITAGILSTSSSSQKIIGHATTRTSVVLFSTDDAGADCIWDLNMENYSITLLYIRNLNFSTNAPIQGLYNYENKRIEKVYWVDGVNQIRTINIKHGIDNQNLEELINLNSNTINMVGNFKITQPVISNIVPGGSHTAGMIQYTYNLYRLNSSQTKLAPMTELVPLDKGANLGGGEVNEVVGATPVVNIKDIDSEYTHIKVYAIKYTSYNQLPSVSLIEDKEIPTNRELNVFDDGNIISELSLEELLFMGSDPIIASHIESKDNTLFPANIQERMFDVDLDTRAYAFDNTSSCKVYNNPKVEKVLYQAPNGFEAYTLVKSGDETNVSSSTFSLIPKHDAVNLYYDKYLYQADGITKGGEGKYLKYEIVQKTKGQLDKREDANKYLKDKEVYRIGIEFYNKLGQTSFPKWVADFRTPEGNLEGNYNTLKVTLKPDFYVWLNTSANFESEDDKPVGYRILRANRTLNDRTVVSQGFLNGMMSNIRSAKDPRVMSRSERVEEGNEGNKLPSLQRVFGKHSTQMEGLEHYKSLSSFASKLRLNEVVTSKGRNGMIANTFQYNTLMQMFSPEAMFASLPVYEGMKLNVRGAHVNKVNDFWGKEIETASRKVIREGKVYNGLTPQEDLTQQNSEESRKIGNINDLCDTGIFGPAQRDTDDDPADTMDFYQFHRDFNGGFEKASQNVVETIYGKPEITEKGQGLTQYNSKPELSYYNTLEPMITDNVDYGSNNTPGLTSVNSWGAKCLTLALGTEDILPENRIALEDLHSKAGITATNCMLVAEIVKDDFQVYMGGIYGGNSYEDKKRTDYIKIGSYNEINNDTIQIDSAGDTFVQNFRFAKIVKTDTEKYSGTTNQITEIVEAKIETSIDLRNRNDISLTPWDSRFQPRYDEYHAYNRVYSQEPSLVKAQDVDYNFKRIRNYDTRIMATKVKIPGEYIDSWTDILINERKDLNGKHGPITGLCSFRDNIYAFQDNSLALIGINPRVQTQGDDGIAIELGTGRLLHDYQYISTTSGTLNKWGIQVTNSAIYFLDGLNKSFMRFTGQGLESLSSSRGLHKYLVNNLDVANLRLDNPYLGTGVSMGYDTLNNDVYLTYNNTWTLCFNEKLDQFAGFYSYDAPLYIYTKERLLTLNPGNMKELYETHAGDYNMFYGQNKESYLTLVANPEADHECIFNNLEYKSVALNDGEIEQRYTWERVRVYNEFQDSGIRDLTSDNMRKLNRKYRLTLPRNQNSTDRIRNNWAFIKLASNNANGYFYLNQDIVLHYIANHIMIR